MRKTLLLIAGILFCGLAKAQIPNPGFETINSLGMASNWRQENFIIFPIDSSCTWRGADSTAITTGDSHSGGHALDIGVATYCENAYCGDIHLFRYDIDTFADQRVPFTERADAFTFYYKLLPVMGDQGSVEIKLEGEDTHVIASATRRFSGPASAWTLATVPLTYSGTDTPTYVTMRFTLHADSIYHYGTRFLIDDINQFGTTGVSKVSGSTQHLKCFPVPADNTLYVDLPGKQLEREFAVTVTDVMGRISKVGIIATLDNRLELNVADLPKGVYFLQVGADGAAMNGKFVK